MKDAQHPTLHLHPRLCHLWCCSANRAPADSSTTGARVYLWDDFPQAAVAVPRSGSGTGRRLFAAVLEGGKVFLYAGATADARGEAGAHRATRGVRGGCPYLLVRTCGRYIKKFYREKPRARHGPFHT